MIKREHIKGAIDAIAGRDPAAGYSLDEMLGAGAIDVPSRQDSSSGGNHFYFLFAGRKVPVNKFVFFNEGIAPIEQALMVKYGELIQKEALQRNKRSIEYREMSREIHLEGLRFMVCHEIDYAIKRAGERPRSPVGSGPHFTTLISSLESIKHEPQVLNTSRLRADSPVWYQGTVDTGTDACFTRFPFCTSNFFMSDFS